MLPRRQSACRRSRRANCKWRLIATGENSGPVPPLTFEDKELERWWYHNQYWLACCLREGKVAPGLFGNWTSGKIGTAWHGDYHMNYNTQQVFWGVFSSNHVEQHLPYIQIVERLMPMSENYARDEVQAAGRLLSALGISGAQPGYTLPCAALGL